MSIEAGILGAAAVVALPVACDHFRQWSQQIDWKRITLARTMVPAWQLEVLLPQGVGQR